MTLQRSRVYQIRLNKAPEKHFLHTGLHKSFHLHPITSGSLHSRHIERTFERAKSYYQWHCFLYCRENMPAPSHTIAHIHSSTFFIKLGIVCRALHLGLRLTGNTIGKALKAIAIKFCMNRRTYHTYMVCTCQSYEEVS